jgi:hypothetical protein
MLNDSTLNDSAFRDSTKNDSTFNDSPFNDSTLSNCIGHGDILQVSQVGITLAWPSRPDCWVLALKAIVGSSCLQQNQIISVISFWMQSVGDPEFYLPHSESSFCLCLKSEIILPV